MSVQTPYLPVQLLLLTVGCTGPSRESHSETVRYQRTALLDGMAERAMADVIAAILMAGNQSNHQTVAEVELRMGIEDLP